MTALPAAFMDAGIDGASYRQLDHWCRMGYLKPIGAKGSGTQRRWPESEAAIARTMVRLIAAGMRVPAAADTARAIHERGELPAKVRLAPNVFLEVWPEPANDAPRRLALVPAGAGADEGEQTGG